VTWWLKQGNKKTCGSIRRRRSQKGQGQRKGVRGDLRRKGNRILIAGGGVWWDAVRGALVRCRFRPAPGNPQGTIRRRGRFFGLYQRSERRKAGGWLKNIPYNLVGERSTVERTTIARKKTLEGGGIAGKREGNWKKVPCVTKGGGKTSTKGGNVRGGVP